MHMMTQRVGLWSPDPLSCFVAAPGNLPGKNVCPGTYNLHPGVNVSACAKLCLADERCEAIAMAPAGMPNATDCRLSNDCSAPAAHLSDYDGYLRKHDAGCEPAPTPPPPPDPRFAWIAAIEQEGGEHHLEARTYLIDRQCKLPDGTRIVGAGSGGGPDGTVVMATPTKAEQAGGRYHGCGGNHLNRQGFVLGSRTYIGHLHYVGFDTARWPDSHPLCGGAPIETPGCADSYCADPSNASLIGGGEGVSHVLVEDISIAGGSTQNAFWIPQTRKIPCNNITVRGLIVNATCPAPGPCRGGGTWADGVNVHGAHHNVVIEGSTVLHSGDDAFALWSEGVSMTNITFRGNVAAHPRYPRTWLASCFAVYGGNHSSFEDNRCEGTGNRGMIFFEKGFHGSFAQGASSRVVNNSLDDPDKPICGGLSFPSPLVNAPGCCKKDA
jgi:hypothetical protein